MKRRIYRVKEFIKNNCLFEYNKVQTFFNSNWFGDRVVNIYDEDDIRIYICYDYEYIEVLGLNEKEQQELLNADYCFQ